MRRILVTNDDGIHSPGIHALAEALERLGEVIVVAPLTEASAIGHALTLRRPLRIETFGAAPLCGGRHADRLREHRLEGDSRAAHCPTWSSRASTRATTWATT